MPISILYPEQPISVCTVYPEERNLSAIIFSIEVSSSEVRILVEVFSMRLVPFSAYSRKRFSPATPIEEVRFRSIMSDLSVEKMIISYRARETATFNRLSPPARFNGPKFMLTRPSASGP